MIVVCTKTAIKGWWSKVKAMVLPKRMEMRGEDQEDVLWIQSIYHLSDGWKYSMLNLRTLKMDHSLEEYAPFGTYLTSCALL